MRICTSIPAVVWACFLGGVAGCGKKEPPAPAPVVVSKDKPAPVVTPPKVEPPPKVEADTGTVTIEFDTTLDPKAIITIGGNDYTPKQLEQPITLPPGTHKLAANQPEVVFQPCEFTVEKGKRKIVRIRVSDQDRRAAEWVLTLGGNIHVKAGKEKDQHVTTVAKLPKEKFRLTVVRLSGAAKKLTDDGLKELKGVQLGELYLTDTPVSDLGVAHIADQTAIFALGLAGTGITDKALEHLRGLTKLGYLGLQKTQVTGTGFQYLKRGPYFTINLDGCPVTDEGLEHLATMPNLRSLGLSDSKVTDKGLAYLAAIPKLNIVRLNGTAVTDRGLEKLRGVKELKEVHMAKTQVTDAGVAELQTALPKLKIVR